METQQSSTQTLNQSDISLGVTVALAYAPTILTSQEAIMSIINTFGADPSVVKAVTFFFAIVATFYALYKRGPAESSITPEATKVTNVAATTTAPMLVPSNTVPPAGVSLMDQPPIPPIPTTYPTIDNMTGVNTSNAQ